MCRFPLKVHCFPHKLNWLGRFEGCYNVKVHTSYFEQINLHFSAALCVTQHGLYTSNLLPMPMMCTWFHAKIAKQGWRGSCYAVLVCGEEREYLHKLSYA